VWRTAIDGIEGNVEEHPLEDWGKFRDYAPPDPLLQADRAPADWDKAQREVEEARAEGRLTLGGLPHGFFFMRLYYLRGFENLMLDIASEEPRLEQLINIVETHDRKMVEKWLSLKVDVMEFGEDLGTQTASTISPRSFRKWVAPSYKRLMGRCREAGCHVVMHSDGYIMELMDDLLKCGVTIINPQDLCNGIDALRREVKGRMCIKLDIDRQKIVPFASRSEIRALIEEEVRKLGSPQGGLEVKVGLYPPTPPENIDAVCDALEEFRTYWWDGRAKGAQ
jgi:hypothetical protein